MSLYNLNENNFTQFEKKLRLKAKKTNLITFWKDIEGDKIKISTDQHQHREIVGENCPLLDNFTLPISFSRSMGYNLKAILEMNKIIEHLSKINTVHFKDNTENTIYKGELKNGLANGLGTIITYKNKNEILSILKGQFKDNKPNGFVKLDTPTFTYIGEYKNEGETCIGFLGNSQFKYFGELKDFVFHGKGSLTEYYTDKPSKRFRGIFQHGNPITLFTSPENENFENFLKLVKENIQNIEKLVKNIEDPVFPTQLIRDKSFFFQKKKKGLLRTNLFYSINKKQK